MLLPIISTYYPSALIIIAFDWLILLFYHGSISLDIIGDIWLFSPIFRYEICKHAHEVMVYETSQK